MGTEREEGFPKFEYGQWTFEGEIERLGAFASGASRAKGPKRWFAVLVVVSFVAPVVVGGIAFFAQLF